VDTSSYVLVQSYHISGQFMISQSPFKQEEEEEEQQQQQQQQQRIS
jgi:hypothetical protein